MRSTDAPNGRRRAARSARALALVALGAFAGGCAERPPNVLVVCIDALRADRLGAYGATPSPTPAIDRLAEDGVVFTEATSVASWTKPSVPSLLSGLYPTEHGVFDNSGRHIDTLAPGVETLAALLGARGWRTAAFVENDQLLRRLSGLDRGFSLYRDGAGTAPQVFDRFLTWALADKHAPWFAYLHVLDPHFPYAPDDWRLPAADTARLSLRVAHWDLRGDYWWLLRRRVNAGLSRLDARALADLDTLYRVEIADVDAALGRLLTVLDAEGELDHTMVVVTADHGDGFLERGFMDHGYGPYAELLRVPLVMRLPGGEKAGTRSDAIVQTVDVAPTVLDVVGVEKPSALRSVSLLPLVRDGRAVRDAAFAEEKHGHLDMVSVREERFHYVRATNAAPRLPGRAAPPVSAAPGARMRARGIHDGSSFVAGSVRHLAPGDPDTEVAGPIEELDGATRSLRVLGIRVSVGDIGDGDDDDLRFGDVVPGQPIRAHGAIRDGVLVATRLERHDTGPIEIEGVLRDLRVVESGDAAMDLGGIRLLVDSEAEWREFPGPAATPDEPFAAPPRTTEELFDRAADPRETRDVGRENPAELARMRALADSWRQSMVAPGEKGRAELDDETRERLRAMGYVE